MSIQNSYDLHEKNSWNSTGASDIEQKIAAWKRRDTADYWRHQRKYNNLMPLIKNDPKATWLTVGDGRYGSDVRFLEENNIDALATDISTEILKDAKDSGYIKKYEKANAEKLHFPDESFDYVLCKESYHHFPRPMVALAEMLRVAKKAALLIEPQDQDIFTRERIRKFPAKDMLWRAFVNYVRVMFLKKSPIAVIGEVNRDDFHPAYEDIGNYVYEISKPELLKVCYGQNFDAIAFREMNDHYIKGGEYEVANDSSALFRNLKKEIEEMNARCESGRQNYDYLIAFLFKKMPEQALIDDLNKAGFVFKKLTKNPHWK
ncbi:MAG: class I SAM-dependent methyltransferase [Flavobacteriales bacterium]